MSQATTWGMQSSAPAARADVAARINASLDALLSSHSGAAAPAYKLLGTKWADTSVAGTITIKMWDGGAWRALYAVNTATGDITVFSANLATLNGNETLTNKTLTSPTVNGTPVGVVSTGAQTLIATEKAQVQANIGLKAANFGRVRLSTQNGFGSTNTKIRRFSTVVKNEGSDITYADSASLGASFTIVNDGVYSISLSAQGSAATGIGISLNSSQLTTNSQNLTDGSLLAGCLSAQANYGGSASWSGFLAAGSIIRAHGDGTSVGVNTAMDKFTIERIG